MKKENLLAKTLVVLFSLFTLNIFSQEGSENQSQSSQEGSENQSQSVKNAIKFVEEFSQYIDNNAIDFTSSDYEKQIFESMKRGVEVSKDFLSALIFTINDYKKNYDQEIEIRGISFYTPIIKKRNYYDFIKNNIDFNFFLQKSITFLNKINNIYEQEKELINLALGLEKIRSTVYELKYLLGTVYYFQGSYINLQNSIAIFEDIIGHNASKIAYATTKKDRQLVYNFLISGIDLLIKKKHPKNNSPITVLENKRKKLSYSWQLIKEVYNDNEKLQNVKFRRLVFDYYPIMDKRGVPFREQYAPFIVKNKIKFD